MQQLQWGILGLDLIAEEFAYHLNRRHSSFAIASPNSKQLSDFAQRHGIRKVYKSYDDLLNDPEIDIIYISTLGNEHFSNIMACLEHGKHVFCEKTMLGNLKDFQTVKAIAQEKHLFLGEAMTIFYMPLYDKIRNLLQSGIIGNLKMIRADFGSLKTASSDNPLFSKDKKGGALMDIGIYALTFVFSFMSSFPTEQAHFMNLHSSGVDEIWNIILKNQEGELANVNLCLRAKLPKRAIIAGDKGYILISDYNRADKASIVFPDGRIQEIQVGSSADAVTYEISKVEHAISCGQYVESNINLTEKVVELMDRLLSN